MTPGSALWDAVAAVLILGPGSPSPLPEHPPDDLFSALQRDAAALDLWSMPGAWGHFPAEVGWCRHMARELACLPPSTDANRFRHLDPEVNIHWFWTAADYAQNVREWRTWEREYWRAVEGTASHYADIWGCVNTLQGQWCSVPCRRQALGRLRELLGVEDYHAGRLPWPGED